MVVSVRGHVVCGTSTINMYYRYVDNDDCMTKCKLREWKGAYGVRPIVCFKAWAMISKQASKKKLSIKHFYWALYWMRTYQVETEAARILGTNAKTLRAKSKSIVRILADAMPRMVSNFEHHI